MRALEPGLQAGSHVVNVVSVAGTVAFAPAGPYSASKHAQLAFSRSLAGVLGTRGVQVHTVLPGFVETELQEQNTNPVVLQGVEKMREQIGDVLQAGDIADAIHYALSRPDHVSINEVLVRPSKQVR